MDDFRVLSEAEINTLDDVEALDDLEKKYQSYLKDVRDILAEKLKESSRDSQPSINHHDHPAVRASGDKSKAPKQETERVTGASTSSDDRSKLKPCENQPGIIVRGTPDTSHADKGEKKQFTDWYGQQKSTPLSQTPPTAQRSSVTAHGGTPSNRSSNPRVLVIGEKSQYQSADQELVARVNKELGDPSKITHLNYEEVDAVTGSHHILIVFTTTSGGTATPNEEKIKQAFGKPSSTNAHKKIVVVFHHNQQHMAKPTPSESHLSSLKATYPGLEILDCVYYTNKGLYEDRHGCNKDVVKMLVKNIRRMEQQLGEP